MDLEHAFGNPTPSPPPPPLSPTAFDPSPGHTPFVLERHNNKIDSRQLAPTPVLSGAASTPTCTMAPSLKSRRAASNSKHPAKPVVPALPLPYVKRQAAPAAAAATASAAAARSLPAQPIPGAVREQAIHHLPVSGAQHDSGVKWDDANPSSDPHHEHFDANGHGSSPGELPQTPSSRLGWIAH